MQYIALILSGALVLAAAIFGISLLFSLPVMLLWDWIMPALFGLKTITWLQAWGLTMLCGFLFKSSSVSSSK